jgi:K+-sensing histidine kinase KdpD
MFVTFKLTDFTYNGQDCNMITVKDVTSDVNCSLLERKNKLATKQASCVSHDMRAPLSTIEFLFETVITKKGVSNKTKKLLKPVRCAAKILNLQVSNLLDYSLL